jgi:hypothetical protein
MVAVTDLDGLATVVGFGGLVGISHVNVIKARDAGTLVEGATYRQWLLAYCHALREVAAGRSGEHQASLTLARIDQAKADTAWKLMQTYERTNQVAAAVQPLMDAWADFLRSAVMAGGQRILENLAEIGADVSPDVILAPLRAALRAGAQYPCGLNPDDGQRGTEAGAIGADADGGVGEPLPEAA